MLRFPVVYKNKPYTPMKISRCKKFVSEGKAIWRYDDKLKIRYLKLKVKPSGQPTIDMRLGWDIGSHFCGSSIVSPKYHHINCEIIHNRSVKDLMSRRRGNRRTRRQRLRHRECRNHSRVADKMSATNHTILQYRQNLILKLLKYYPVSKVIVEKVICTNFQQQGWTQVHQGQNNFIKFLRSIGLNISVVRGYHTKNKRVSLFGTDPKILDKGKKIFGAHAVDSFSIACMGIVDSLKQLRVNSKTRFLSCRGLVRRQLFQFKHKYDKRLPNGTVKYTEKTPYYIRYRRKGIPVIFKHMSKIKKIRVLQTETDPKHPKSWRYLYTESVETWKKFLKKYGGTKVEGQKSKYQNNQGGWDRLYVEVI